MSKPLAFIVEDDKDSARLYARIMKPLDYKFEYASTKAEAMAHLDKVVPNLVLLDMSLVKKKMDDSGVEILQRIRADDRFAKTRVIVISAYSKLIDDYKDQTDGVIIKPVSAKKLTAMINSLN